MRQPGVSPAVLGAAEAEAADRGRKWRWFFVSMSLALLAVVVVGFSPTFFLRGYFGTAQLPPGLRTLPAYLWVHGIVLTSWFLLFFAQTVLVASHRTDLHRRLGISGGVLAVAVILVSAFVLIRAIHGPSARGTTDAALPGVIGVAIGDLITFSILVSAGFYFRRQPETHKRLMYLASFGAVGAAIARPLPGADPNPIYFLAVFLSLLIALPLYDIVCNRRRIHRATGWGLLVGTLIHMVTAIWANGASGGALIRALR
jgi:hypothetical protein